MNDALCVSLRLCAFVARINQPPSNEDTMVDKAVDPFRIILFMLLLFDIYFSTKNHTVYVDLSNLPPEIQKH